MVRGVLRKTVLVNPPEKGIFEQVIFVLKDSAAMDGGLTQEQVLEQANRHLEQYLDFAPPDKGKRVTFAAACAGVGVAITAFAWLATGFIR